MQIFIINGRAACGKSVFGEYVGKVLEKEGIPFIHDSSVKPVKDLLKKEGWDGVKWDGVTKDDFWRRIMHECKCKMINEDKHVFDKYALKTILNLGKKNKNSVMFFDIREPENILQIVSYFKKLRPDIGVFTVFVERNVDLVDFDNYADTNQLNYDYDISVDNNGELEDLYENARQFVAEHVVGEVSDKLVRKNK